MNITLTKLAALVAVMFLIIVPVQAGSDSGTITNGMEIGDSPFYEDGVPIDIDAADGPHPTSMSEAAMMAIIAGESGTCLTLHDERVGWVWIPCPAEPGQ